MKKLLLMSAAVGLMPFLSGVSLAGDTSNVVIAPHAKDLVVLQGDKLVAFESSEFMKAPYIVLYYGAGWCPDCRRFSPTLVEAYNKQTKGGKRFEVLLVSRDKSADGMLKFMKTEKMSWPALAFEKIASAEDLKKYYSGHGIPCLTVIDPNGKLLLQSKSDQDGEEVLRELLSIQGGKETANRH
jgi:nucleoredoxin